MRYSYTCEVQLHLGGTATAHHFFEPGEEGVLVSEIRDMDLCGRAYFGQYTISMVPYENFVEKKSYMTSPISNLNMLEKFFLNMKCAN